MSNQQKISRYRELVSSLKNSGSYIATGKEAVEISESNLNDQIELNLLIWEIGNSKELLNMLNPKEILSRELE